VLCALTLYTDIPVTAINTSNRRLCLLRIKPLLDNGQYLIYYSQGLIKILLVKRDLLDLVPAADIADIALPDILAVVILD